MLSITRVNIPKDNKPEYYASMAKQKTLCRSSNNTPIKIWIAEDDKTVSIDNCKGFVQSLHNGGYKAEIRLMPANTGAHHAVDNDPAALQTLDVTTRLGVHYDSVPTAYYELAGFFDSL